MDIPVCLYLKQPYLQRAAVITSVACSFVMYLAAEADVVISELSVILCLAVGNAGQCVHD